MSHPFGEPAAETEDVADLLVGHADVPRLLDHGTAVEVCAFSERVVHLALPAGPFEHVNGLGFVVRVGSGSRSWLAVLSTHGASLALVVYVVYVVGDSAARFDVCRGFPCRPVGGNPLH